MKAIKLNAVITSISSKKDRSLGLRIETPELTTTERSEIMDIQGMNVDLFIKPLDEEAAGITEIKTELDSKTQSQRIKAVLYILWKQDMEDMDFNTYYQSRTERIIEYLKSKINED